MSCSKYSILDDSYYLRIMGPCADDEKRGLVALFDLTGMTCRACERSVRITSYPRKKGRIDFLGRN